MRGAHDTAARGAGGLGGLYRLQSGLSEPASGLARWFQKPSGVAYRELYGQVPADATLWRRQMVLGPAPEFLLEGTAPPPSGIVPVAVHRRLLIGGSET